MMTQALYNTMPIDVLSPGDIRHIASHEGGMSVSLYMPCHRVGTKKPEDMLRFKNLVSRAKDMLEESGMDERSAEKHIRPLRKLQSEEKFWEQQNLGLACFLKDDDLSVYRLPVTFEERVHVDDRFHIKPLMPFAEKDDVFYALALSKHRVMLYKVARCTLEHVKTPDMPGTIEEALKYDDPERQVQFHSGTPAGTSREGKRSAMYHGQGVNSNDDDDEVERFFRIVNRVVHRTLGKNHYAPLVLAAIGEYHALYRKVNTYDRMVETGVMHNPFDMSGEEFHHSVWEAVSPVFMKKRNKLKDHFRDVMGTGGSSAKIEQVVPAAYDGRVEALFVNAGETVEGQLNTETGSVEDGEEDLVELGALYTLKTGGDIYAEDTDDVLDDGPLAAIFRY